MLRATPSEETVPTDALGRQLATLRILDPAAVRAVQSSLARHGQLTALVAFRAPEGALEIIDGFKRHYAAKSLRAPRSLWRGCRAATSGPRPRSSPSAHSPPTRSSGS